MDAWTIAKLLDWTTGYFKKFNIEWPHLEAEILLAHALGLKRIQLYTQHEKIPTKGELARFKGFIERRSKHEPIAYITGVQPFMGLDFFLDRNVLIPRPETEKLVEVAIDIITNSCRSDSQSDPVVGTKSPDYAKCVVADIGTGSGAIAVSLAKYLPNIKVIGIDSSSEVIKIAQKNAEFHQVADSCQFLTGNLLEPLKEPVNLIVANPPYIPSVEIEKLGPDVKDWEPRQALDGGKDGLDYIRKLIKESPQHLKENRFLIVEFGINQADEIRELSKGFFKEIKIIKDNSGKERIFWGLF